MIGESGVAWGRGNFLYDVKGRRYLDGSSWLWGNTLGHGDPDLRTAAQAHLDGLSRLTLGESAADVSAGVSLAELLGPVVPVREPRLLLAADGPAAVARAAALAFEYWRDRSQARRTALLVLRGAAHLLDPSPLAVMQTVGYDDPAWLATGLATLEQHSDRLAGVIIEPLVQGAAGVQVAKPAEVATFVDAVQARGIPLICDEVLTGFGRTGTLFAADQCLITADIVCMGSSLTSGYFPMGATAVGSHIFADPPGEADLAVPGDDHIGASLVMAVAARHLELLRERRILDHVAEMADHLRAALTRLTAHGAVGTVGGRGLMMGLRLKPFRAEGGRAAQVCAAARRKGVLLSSVDDDVVAIMPPLSITRPEIDAIAGALLAALDEVAT